MAKKAGCPIPTRKQIEDGILKAIKALGIANHKEISLDTQLSEVITEDLEDGQFPAELQRQFPALSPQDLNKIQELYPVKRDIICGESMGLNLGRSAEKDCTFRDITEYIYSRYKSGFSKTR